VPSTVALVAAPDDQVPAGPNDGRACVQSGRWRKLRPAFGKLGPGVGRPSLPGFRVPRQEVRAEHTPSEPARDGEDQQSHNAGSDPPARTAILMRNLEPPSVASRVALLNPTARVVWWFRASRHGRAQASVDRDSCSS
jgi:hypothetical protein